MYGSAPPAGTEVVTGLIYMDPAPADMPPRSAYRVRTCPLKSFPEKNALLRGDGRSPPLYVVRSLMEGVIVARIIFLCPFAKKNRIGDKDLTTIQLVAQRDLAEAWVYQPEGSFLVRHARPACYWRLITRPGVLGFPRNGSVACSTRWCNRAARKVLFCQAHYYTLFNSSPWALSRAGLKKWCARARLQRVLGRDAAPLRYRDHLLLHRCGAVFPRAKTMRSRLSTTNCRAKRHSKDFQPQISASSIDPLAVVRNQNRTRKRREIFRPVGDRAVPCPFGIVRFGAVGRWRRGAIVAGFRGYGVVQELCASPRQVVSDFPNPIIWRKWRTPLRAHHQAVWNTRTGPAEIRDAGLATAAHYSKERTRAALRAFYGEL